MSYSADHLDTLGTGFNDVNGGGPAEFALRVDIPWERAHKRELRQDAAGYQKRIVQARIAESIRRLTLDVSLACIEVMEAKSKLALANENLQSLEGIVTLNLRRVSGGAIAPVELTRSRVAMLQFRASVKTAELALLTARTRLQTLLGRKPVDGVIDVAGAMRVSLPAQGPDLSRIQDLALKSRPDLQVIQLDQARSQADLRLQIAQGKIDYTFGAEYRRQPDGDSHECRCPCDQTPAVSDVRGRLDLFPDRRDRGQHDDDPHGVGVARRQRAAPTEIPQGDRNPHCRGRWRPA